MCWEERGRAGCAEEIRRKNKRQKLKFLLTFIDSCSSIFCGQLSKSMRKCRNWQTSKTKDLVAFGLCGFKSHLPHYERNLDDSRFLLRCEEFCPGDGRDLFLC